VRHCRAELVGDDQGLAKGGVSFDALESLANTLPDIADRLRRLPVDVVFDHMAQADARSGLDEPGFHVLLDLLSTGFWVKLSNARFDPNGERARRLVAVNPERVVWGSDWPHVSHEGEAPDDGALLDHLRDWVPDEKVHRAALVDNPALIYFRN
jgi:predicted TIM-barrel fold metal-dependent hydrolase